MMYSESQVSRAIDTLHRLAEAALDAGSAETAQGYRQQATAVEVVADRYAECVRREREER